MAYTDIDDPSAYFQTFTYTGNQSSRQITLDGNSDLQPDLYWYKARNANHHYWVDSSRGTTKYIYSSLANAEATVASAYVTSFNTNGFGVGGGDSGTNANGISFGNWAWKANGGTTTAFSESGNNPGGTYQANTTAGFSIVTYTGTGAAGTVTHGLGAAPKLIIIKNRDVADPWAVLPPDRNDLYLVLNTTVGWAASSAFWNDTAPSSTVFTVNTDHSVNADGEAYVAYCFAEKQGYSKFGTYFGNGNANGAFVYTGFKPALVMFKVLSDPNYGWSMIDNTRSPSNLMNDDLYTNSSAAEVTDANKCDFLSNGFKLRGSTYPANAGGSNQYVYFAWAENPFVTSTGIPCTAR
jgi:hypothetical protein